MAHAQCQPGWLPGAPYPGVNGSVYATTHWDPDGPGPLEERLVIAGLFTIAGDQLASNIAMWDGSAASGWTRLGAGISGVILPQQIGPVMALTVYNGELIVGGTFTGAGGSAVNNIARWDGTTWRPLGGGLGAASSSLPMVSCLAVYHGELIAGGAFAAGNGQSGNRIARWDGSVWRPLGDGPGIEGGWVTTMMVQEDDLLVGGSFSQAGGVAADRLALWNGETWRAFPAQIPTTTDAWPSAMTRWQGQLVVAVTNFVGFASSVILRWNGANWEALGSVSAGVFAMREYQGQLLIAGYHLAYRPVQGGTYYRVAEVLRRDESQVPVWRSVGPSGSDVYCLEEFQGRVIAAGGVGLCWADQLPAEGGQSWIRPTWPFDPYLKTEYAFSYRDSLVLAGATGYGSSTTSLPNPITLWNGAHFETIGDVRDPVVPLPGESFSAIYGLTELESDLIVCGRFTSINGRALANIARWHDPGTGWRPLGPGLPGAEVICVCVHDGALHAGTSNGQVLRFDGSAWQPLPAFGGTVSAIASFQGQLYAAGLGSIKRLSATGWVPLPDVVLTSGFVNCFLQYRGELIVGGIDLGFAGPYRNCLLSWTGTDWRLFGSSLLRSSGTLLYGVTALAEYNGDLVAAGDFTLAPGAPRPGVARWSAAAGGWSTMNGGTNSSAWSLGRLGPDLVAGGGFYTAGNQVSYLLARGSDSAQPWLSDQPQSSVINCSSSIATFSVAPADGFANLFYVWRRDGVPLSDGPTGSGSSISGSQSPTLTIHQPGPLDQGTYSCLVANACGSAASSGATLVVSTQCAADLNCSGGVEPADLSLFVSRWFAGTVSGSLETDFNGDRVITPADLSGFVGAWLGEVQNGCG